MSIRTGSVASSRLKNNIASLFALQVATYVLPLISLPYLVRVLGTEKFGLIAFAMAFVQYFLVMIDYGFNLSATRQSAMLKGDAVELSKMLTGITAIKLMLLVSGFILMLMTIALVPGFEHDWMLYLLAYLGVLGHAISPAWLFQGLERMRVITGCTIAAQILFLLALIVLVKSPDDYRVAAGLQGMASVAAGVFAWVFVWRMGSLRLLWPGWPYLNLALRDGWHVFISTAAISLYTTTNTVALGLISNPQAVAYFAVAEKLIRAVQGLISPISHAVYPYIARLSLESRDSAFVFIRRLLQWQSCATFLLSAAILLFAGPLVALLFGTEFVASKSVVQLMAPLPFIIGISNVLGIQTMLNFGMKDSFSRILLSSGLVNLILLVPLASLYGAQGAAISVVLTEIVVAVLMGLALARSGILPRLLSGHFV